MPTLYTTKNPSAFPDLADGGGMTLRDYFAAQVVSAVYRRVSLTIGSDESQQTIAKEAYELADAMLAERAK